MFYSYYTAQEKIVSLRTCDQGQMSCAFLEKHCQVSQISANLHIPVIPVCYCFLHSGTLGNVQELLSIVSLEGFASALYCPEITDTSKHLAVHILAAQEKHYLAQNIKMMNSGIIRIQNFNRPSQDRGICYICNYGC